MVIILHFHLVIRLNYGNIDLQEEILFYPPSQAITGQRKRNEND